MTSISPPQPARPRVLEFFAGIGLARMGLEQAGFQVVWANDIEHRKKTMYDAEFGASSEHEFALADIAEVQVKDLPGNVELAWASSPCTDLSLAGMRNGLSGKKSSVFWNFTEILADMGAERPPLVVLENVVGLATSHGGADLRAAIQRFNELRYSVDVIVMDARRFLPQSRPRLFVIGAQNPPVGPVDTESALRPSWLDWVFADASLRTHRAPLPTPPPLKTGGLSGIVETMHASDPRWWDAERTEKFVRSLSDTQLERVRALQESTDISYRTAYRRTRQGKAVWEVRTDEVAGCLRTARGGSSKQAVVELGRGNLRVRWMTPRECARLMGAGAYNLSTATVNQAIFGFGDAVAVPVVAWLAEHYLRPLLPREAAEGLDQEGGKTDGESGRRELQRA